MPAWQPRLDILPTAQRDLWSRLDIIPSRFSLYGGTGLAIRLGHRRSVDFDFLSDVPFRPDDLMAEVSLIGHGRIEQTGANTLVVTVDSVQVSFFGGLDFGVLDTPDRARPGPSVASLLDLAGTKVKALVDRSEVKDYLDIDAIVQAGVPLPDVLGAFAVLFPGVSPMIVVRALGYLDDPQLASLPDPVRRRLERAIGRLRTITPMLTRYPSISAAASAVSDPG